MKEKASFIGFVDTCVHRQDTVDCFQTYCSTCSCNRTLVFGIERLFSRSYLQASRLHSVQGSDEEMALGAGALVMIGC